MSAQPNYPQPYEDADNAPFLTAWRKGVLALQRCKGCGKAIYYPRPMCPHCWSADLEWFEASGQGTVVGYGVVWRPNHESFQPEVPVVLVEVALAEGPLMLSRVVGDDREKTRSGAAVRLVTMPDAVRYPLPTFRLA